MMRLSTVLNILLFTKLVEGSFGFCAPSKVGSRREISARLYEDEHKGVRPEVDPPLVSRRNWFGITATIFGTILGGTGVQLPARAEDGAVVVVENSIEMKNFIDPQGLFSIRVPKSYFALRRSDKGDLPDPKTGKGRRGSSIFTAGDMNKAEIVAVERFPTRSLLEDNGIEANGDLSTFPKLGEPAAIANLINLRRDKQGISNTKILPESVAVSEDGKELVFKLKTEIEVQKPELLLEQYGVSELFRVTTAKASLKSNDGNLMAVFASALETDFRGPDGIALQEAVDSFLVTDQASTQTA